VSGVYPGTVEFDEHVCEAIRLAAWEQCGVELPDDAGPGELVRILYLTEADQ
jgi:hypothetical protein